MNTKTKKVKEPTFESEIVDLYRKHCQEQMIVKQKTHRRVEHEDLVPGNVYMDFVHTWTEMEYVKFVKSSKHLLYFKYESGPKRYEENKQGLIVFRKKNKIFCERIEQNN